MTSGAGVQERVGLSCQMKEAFRVGRWWIPGENLEEKLRCEANRFVRVPIDINILLTLHPQGLVDQDHPAGRYLSSRRACKTVGCEEEPALQHLQSTYFPCLQDRVDVLEEQEGTEGGR